MSHEGWFTRTVQLRVNNEHNVLMIVEGETGTGKSCLGLSLAQSLDPYFSSKRIAFNASEFFDLLKTVPHKGWILWDECGVGLSHREYQRQHNIEVMKVIQSFRYKFINVIFTVPSASYLDKVAREMCHYLLRLKKRGQASVYRIMKSPFEGHVFTPFIGNVYAEMPTSFIWEEFRELHAEHQEILYEKARKQMEADSLKAEKKLESDLKPKDTLESFTEKAMLILPQIVDPSKITDQGLVDVAEMQRILRVPHNKAYNLRKAVIKELHKHDDELLKRLAEKKAK